MTEAELVRQPEASIASEDKIKQLKGLKPIEFLRAGMWLENKRLIIRQKNECTLLRFKETRL